MSSQRLVKIFMLAIGLLLVGCVADQVLKADAGPDFTLSIGESPTFNGCASAGNITNFQWKILEAPEAMAEDNGKVIKEMYADCAYTLETEMGFEEMGIWIIELEVTDDQGATAVDTVAIDVK